MVKNLIALKKQKRVGYFLFFHSLNCLMKTKGSHITPNGNCFVSVVEFEKLKLR